MLATFVKPDWPAPANVHAYCTTRVGGVSPAPYNALNLAEHVDDEAANVVHNRALLSATLNLPRDPVWLSQIHSNRVLDLAHAKTQNPEADASITLNANQVCVVMTADCLPVLLCNRQGTFVAAVHAGWRGLHSEILAATVARYPGKSTELLAWLGPAIGPANYEIDEHVYAEFTRLDPRHASAFVATRPGHWSLDLYEIARQQLHKLGIDAIYGGEFCTYRDSDRFYSFRRDTVTGRFASLIWRAS